jgi:hypothetical protein
MTTSSSAVFREHRVFFAATALVMLHIIDDSFVQPAAGMTPADHLVSGLVPLGLMALAAWGYPRVRPGTRAVIALGAALAGLVTGLTEPVSHLVQDSFAGDDISGLLAGASGLVLVVLAVRTLWRSRRSDGSRIGRYARRSLEGLLGLVVLVGVVLPFGGGYVSTHISRIEVPPADLGAAYEDVTLTTSDGLHLEGWYVPSRNGAAVIVFPGRKTPQAHARMLVRHGYGVLLLDRRGEGESDGESHGFGWGGARDIHAAVDFLRRRPDVEPGRIGGIGLSVGGEMMLQAAAENPDLAAVVTEGAGARSYKEGMEQVDGPERLRDLVPMAANQIGLAVFSNMLPPPSLVEIVPEIAPRPVLLIFAPDGGTTETLSPLYGRLIGASADVWALPGVDHLKGFESDPEEYERRVVGFFDRALLAPDL